jgi:prepilin-type N-terminal cleavage/methylation domain-containing protein
VQTKNQKNEGGKRMKNLFKNNKGFSLVELLIVFAILAIMAVVSFNIFGGMTNNAKIKADEEIASSIEKALNAYIADSGDALLGEISYFAPDTVGTFATTKTYVKGGGQWSSGATATTAALIIGTLVQGDWDTNELIAVLQGDFHNEKTGRNYGNLLTPKQGGKLISETVAAEWPTNVFNNFKPQGTGYTGYDIDLDTKTMQCKVTPSKGHPGSGVGSLISGRFTISR